VANVHSIEADIEWFVTEGTDNDLQAENTNNDNQKV